MIYVPIIRNDALSDKEILRKLGMELEKFKSSYPALQNMSSSSSVVDSVESFVRFLAALASCPVNLTGFYGKSRRLVIRFASVVRIDRSRSRWWCRWR